MQGFYKRQFNQFGYAFTGLLFLLGVVLSSLLAGTVAYAGTPYAASDVVGQADFTSQFRNGVVAPNTLGLYNPTAVALDSTHHRLFIADTNNHRVLIFNLNTNNEFQDHEADNVLGQPNFTSSGDVTTQSGMRRPQGLAYDVGNDRLFVSDSLNRRVLVFDVSTITNGENAVNVLGQANFTTTGSAVTTQSSMNEPQGLAYDAGNNLLFIADNVNRRVLAFDVSTITNGENAVNVLGQPNFTGTVLTHSQSVMSAPRAVELDSANARLFVADMNRVLAFDVSTIADGENAVNVLGQPNFTSNIFTTAQNGTTDVIGLAYDPNNDRLFVSDSTRVLAFDVSTIADGENAVNVLGQPNFTSSIYITSQNNMNSSGGVVYDPANDQLYVADSSSRILLFDTTTITDSMPATDLLGQLDNSNDPDFTSNYVNNVRPNNHGFQFVSDIVVDTTRHRLFVADSGNNRILVYNLDSSNTLLDQNADFVLGQPNFDTEIEDTAANRMDCNYYCGLAYDSARNLLFVSDTYRVLVFNTSTIANGENAVNIIGQPNFTATNSTVSQKEFEALEGGLAYDQTNQRLFVPDPYNSRIMIFDLSGTITDFVDASHVLGVPDFTTVGCDTTSVSELCLDYTGIQYDPVAQQLFVSDHYNNRVMVFDTNPATIQNGEDASFVLGQSDFTSFDCDVTVTALCSPEGLALDVTRRQLFVTDNYARVLVYDITSLSNGEAAVGVLGQLDFDSDSRGLTQSMLDPDNVNIGFDPTNRRLYVPDSWNTRILQFDFAYISTGTVPNGKVGDMYSQTIDVAGDQGTLTFSKTSGTLPPGLVLGATTGDLSGTPTQAGTYNFSVTATDVNGNAGTYSDTKNYSMIIAGVSSSSGANNDTGSNTSGSGNSASAEPDSDVTVSSNSDETGSPSSVPVSAADTDAQTSLQNQISENKSSTKASSKAYLGYILLGVGVIVGIIYKLGLAGIIIKAKN